MSGKIYQEEFGFTRMHDIVSTIYQSSREWLFLSVSDVLLRLGKVPPHLLWRRAFRYRYARAYQIVLYTTVVRKAYTKGCTRGIMPYVGSILAYHSMHIQECTSTFTYISGIWYVRSLIRWIGDCCCIDYLWSCIYYVRTELFYEHVFEQRTMINISTTHSSTSQP